MAGTQDGLTTRGRCLVAAGIAAAICALVLNERDLLRLGVFIVALPLLALALSGRARTGLQAARQLVPRRVPVGGESRVELLVQRTSRFAGVGLLLDDGVPGELGEAPRFVVERLGSHGRVALRYQLRPRLRGIHTIGPLTARITDPLGLTEYHRRLGGHDQLVVTPAVVPLSGVPTGGSSGSGDHGAARLRGGHGEDDVNVRTYQQGDDLRKVHWRSTARRDELMVRIEERPWRGGATVLLDRRADSHRGSGPDSSLEWAISLVASICLQLQRHGQRIRLLSEDGRLLAGTEVTGGENVGETVLDALAAVAPSPQRDLPAGTSITGGQELFAVFGAITPAAAQRMLHYRPPGMRSHAVLLDVTRWAGDPSGSRGTGDATDPEAAARLLTSAGWLVTITDPEAAMEEVWERLCAGASATAP